MERKYNRKKLEERFPNTFESIYAIMEYEYWNADELEKRWIRDNLFCSLNSVLQEFKINNL